MCQKLKFSEIIKKLPPEWPDDLLTKIRNWLQLHPHSVIVLDDDPTGTQTVQNVPVLTWWNDEILIKELKLKPDILYLLTNSRSLVPDESRKLITQIGNQLNKASNESGRGVCVVSRSDSTLRGHYPLEVDSLIDAMNLNNAVQLLIPAFFQGDRYTINDMHYLLENDNLIPAAKTIFAKDASFGYKESNLKQWVQEKTKGRIKAEDIVSISLENIRKGGPDTVRQILSNCLPGSVCIINAVSLRDLEVFTLAMYQSKDSGQRFILRTAASIVPILAGHNPQPLLSLDKIYSKTKTGGLIVVGSYVPKTTSQLKYLLNHSQIKELHVPVREILESNNCDHIVSRLSNAINNYISNGNDVVLYTSRKVHTGKNATESLEIVNIISRSIVEIVERISVIPNFFIAKGGITSSDIATKAFKTRKALAIGQIIPGVPVWILSESIKFQGMNYVIFPGNVGGDDALCKVYNILKQQKI